MGPEPKVRHCLVKTYDLLDLKVYIFDIGRYNRGLEQLDAVVLDNRKEFKRIGNLGITTIYGYPGENGFVDGANVFIFRDKQHENHDPENPMIHPFSFENYERLPDLGKSGGLCRKEAIILGRECELHRKLKDRKKYLETWACDIEV